MTRPVLGLYDVSRSLRRGWMRARVPAINGVSVELVAGEITLLLGAAGAGKSTLLRLAAGQLAVDAGTIRVAGWPPASDWARRLLGVAPEHAAFPPALTVREVLEYYARFHRGPRRTIVREAIEIGGLGAVAARRVGMLSRSESRRLALAQAVLGGRRILLLDETLTGLDPAARVELTGAVRRLADDGAALLIAAGDPASLERLAGRALVLHGGRIVREGPLPLLLGDRVLDVVLDALPREPPPGFRFTAAGLEADLGARTAEAALAVCRAHRLAVRASRVRFKSLDEVVLGSARDAR